MPIRIQEVLVATATEGDLIKLWTTKVFEASGIPIDPSDVKVELVAGLPTYRIDKVTAEIDPQ